MITHWQHLTAPELRERAAADALVILPVASLEQHGPHLATGVDMVLAGAVAGETARKLAGRGEAVVVTPVVWTGLAEHHMDFGGTVTLDNPAFQAVLRGVARSVARHGFRRLMLLNGHGGNAEAIGVAVTALAVELGIKVAGGTYWHIAPEAIAPILEDQSGLMHACEAETSLMLHLSPGDVRRERIAEAHGPHSTRAPGQPPGLMRRRGFREISETGVIGDARRASAEKGERLLDAVSSRLAKLLADPALWR